MSNKDTDEFFKWLKKSKATEADIINCRKMQNPTIVENETIFGISSISICGFINNDVVKLGSEIKQQYDESKEVFYQRAFGILNVAAKLMDAVNEILKDEGAWSSGYFEAKLADWKTDRLKDITNK